MGHYEYLPFEYVTPPELVAEQTGEKAPNCYPVAIVGAGPIGLAMAIDLALKDIPSVVLDDNNVVSVGSRAICWAKRTLEIFDRLGVGKRMLEKGVTWKIGRLFHGSKEVYNFDLLPEEGHTYPAFINLQQYYVEQYLVERAQEFPELIDLRFKNKVIDHHDMDDYVRLTVETPGGEYTLNTEYMIACDGAGSPTRKRMDLPFNGQTFEEKFLIVDVKMEQSPFGSDLEDAAERWFWFEPDFHQGNSALLHKQPDNIYRIDFQLQPDADEAEEKRKENLDRRLKAMIGDKPYTLDWMSIYRFICAKLDKFVHNRVLFVGDSAHVVSPFGARGGNGGVQDLDNLGWKLAAVLTGDADIKLLDTYCEERRHGSAENILNSSRATNFMTPKSPMEKLFRDEVLQLAKETAFARRIINSGRLSLPCSLEKFVPETRSVEALIAPGLPAIDAPLQSNISKCSIINLLGNDFALISFGAVKPDIDVPKIRHIHVYEEGHLDPLSEQEFIDISGFAFARYGVGFTYLFRPDAHVSGVWDIAKPFEIEYAVKAVMNPTEINGVAAE